MLTIHSFGFIRFLRLSILEIALKGKVTSSVKVYVKYMPNCAGMMYFYSKTTKNVSNMKLIEKHLNTEPHRMIY